MEPIHYALDLKRIEAGFVPLVFSLAPKQRRKKAKIDKAADNRTGSLQQRGQLHELNRSLKCCCRVLPFLDVNEQDRVGLLSMVRRNQVPFDKDLAQGLAVQACLQCERLHRIHPTPFDRLTQQVAPDTDIHVLQDVIAQQLLDWPVIPQCCEFKSDITFRSDLEFSHEDHIFPRKTDAATVLLEPFFGRQAIDG